jgi:hypothetical protein
VNPSQWLRGTTVKLPQTGLKKEVLWSTPDYGPGFRRAVLLSLVSKRTLYLRYDIRRLKTDALRLQSPAVG